jgi:hypothetical protein
MASSMTTTTNLWVCHGYLLFDASYLWMKTKIMCHQSLTKEAQVLLGCNTFVPSFLQTKTMVQGGSNKMAGRLPYNAYFPNRKRERKIRTWHPLIS